MKLLLLPPQQKPSLSCFSSSLLAQSLECFARPPRFITYLVVPAKEARVLIGDFGLVLRGFYLAFPN